MTDDTGRRKSIARDAEFRALLGSQFDQFSDDELEVFIEAVMDSMRDSVEEIIATVPIIPGLSVKA
jgi:hypothetical protein